MKIFPFFLQNAGCPHYCLFCDQDRSVSSVGPLKVEEILCQLDDGLPNAGEGEIAFYGGTFTLLSDETQKVYLDAAHQFVVAGRAAGIRISTRPDALADDCIRRLKASGVTTIEIGCQSFDDRVLISSKRGHSADDNRLAVQRCLDAGINVGIQLMPGLPESDPDEALLSLTDALALVPTFLRIYPTVVIEGTALADLWRSGAYVPWPLDNMVDVCADMLHECRLANIPVIRIGLQQDLQLSKNLLAGPYHPAFGQLVRSRLWRRAIASVAANNRQFIVNPVDLSDAIGHGGENREWLEKNHQGLSLKADQKVLPGSLQIAGREEMLINLLARGESHV